ncbi:acyl carrier protein [Acetobacteraceae bacterium]|nr:acyl carrier protein [Acetobacteraceae bacterium]
MADADIKAIKERLTGVFRKVFKNPNLNITEEMSADDVKDWDSLTHIALIIGTEKEFSIKLKTREVRGMNNVGDLIRLITQKL